jgi:uncharacterized integral membrane protein
MIRILISIPLLIVLIAFALSNQQPVQLGLWPTDIVLSVPLSVAILVAAAIFFVVGAFMTWAGAVASRGRARRAERSVRELRAQVAVLRDQQAEARRTAGQNLVLLPPQ